MHFLEEYFKVRVDILIGGLDEGVSPPVSPLFYLDKLSTCADRHLWNPSSCFMKKNFFKKTVERAGGGERKDRRDRTAHVQGAVRLTKLWAQEVEVRRIPSCLLELLVLKAAHDWNVAEAMEAPNLFQHTLQHIAANAPLKLAMPYKKKTPSASKLANLLQVEITPTHADVVLCPCNPTENYARLKEVRHAATPSVRSCFEELRRQARITLLEMQPEDEDPLDSLVAGMEAARLQF